MLSKVIVKSPAKINLFLDILNRREDGYHNVNMVMQSVSLFDTIVINRIKENKVILNVPKYKFLQSKNNLNKNTAIIATNEFFKVTGISNFGVKITIFKSIPICAGLAGGSTDAAAVLVGLNEMFSKKLSKAELLTIGKNIGADVPFCIFGGTMLATDKGTKLTSLNHIPHCYFVLCKPKIRVSTRAAYEASDKNEHIEKSLKDILSAIKFKSLRQIANSTYNSFEDVLKLKEVERIKYIMKQSGAFSACMSGSGPTVYGIFNNKNVAIDCKNNLRKEYKEVFLCIPQKFGSEVILAE